MHRYHNLGIFVVGCLVVVASCFLPWTHEPRYSLFTIADYAGSYGRYISPARYVSYAAFLIPLGASVTLVSAPFERICRVVTIILGTYSLVFAIIVVMLVWKISDSFPTPTQTLGAYITLVTSVILLMSAIVGARKQRT